MIGQVDRVSGLSVATFQEEYLSRRPVIITDVMADWKAMKWTVQDLHDRSRHAKLPVRMDDIEFDAFCAATNNMALRESKEARRLTIEGSFFWIIPLDAYFAAVLRGGRQIQTLPYVCNVPLSRSLMTSYLRALGISSFEDWEPLFSTFEELASDLAFPEYLVRKRDYRFWFTPWSRKRGIIHADGYDNLNAQISGRKEWILSSGRLTETDLEQGVTFSCVTEQGEILYIPKSWWHSATAVGTCINVNAWHLPPMADI